jgi:glycerol-3-phosphate dehydrogenase
VLALPGAGREIADGLSEAMVRFAVRFEYARCVEDVLARRSRLLFLDARQASSIADRIGQIVREETGLDPQVEAFQTLAQGYLLP